MGVVSNGGPETAVTTGRGRGAAAEIKKIYSSQWNHGRQAIIPSIPIGRVPSGVTLPNAWATDVKEHVARLARASQVEMRASLGPDYDGKTKTRRDLNAKRTCALDACLEL
eukprot:4623960-Pyramimonas_sp.AAC.1